MKRGIAVVVFIFAATYLLLLIPEREPSLTYSDSVSQKKTTLRMESGFVLAGTGREIQTVAAVRLQGYTESDCV